MRAAIIPLTLTCLIRGETDIFFNSCSKIGKVCDRLFISLALLRNSKLAKEAAQHKVLADCVPCKSAPGSRLTNSSRLKTAAIGREEEIPLPRAMMSGLISEP